MKLLKIDFNAIQQAMEDVSRDKNDYFLDLETGEIKIISIEALEKAEALLYKDNDESISDDKHAEEPDIPEWMEKELELTIKIFSEKERYARIPERESQGAYSLMKKFIDSIEELKPHDKLTDALNSQNSFSRFKKTLSDFPELKKRWFAFNASSMRGVIIEWLKSIGIKPEQLYH